MGIISSITGSMGGRRPDAPTLADPAPSRPDRAAKRALAIAAPIGYLTRNWERTMKAVDSKIEAARARLAEAERAFEAAALEAVDDPNSKALAAAEQALEAARRRVGTLAAAKRAAKSMQAAEATATAEAELQERWNKTRAACKQREAAARECDKAITALAGALDKLRESTVELHRQCPVSLRFETGASWDTLISAGVEQALAEATKDELFTRRISTRMREAPTVMTFVNGVDERILNQKANQ